MNNFTFTDGIVVSVFSMTLVFVILILLSFIIELISRVISKFENKSTIETKPEIIANDDAEEKLVAQIVASCLLQKENQGNVRIKSIIRVK